MGLPTLRRGGKELLGPGQVLAFLKGEHGRDKARRGLAMGTNSGRPTGLIGACEGVILAAALLPLAWPAIDQEVFLGSPKLVLEAVLLPKRERLAT